MVPVHTVNLGFVSKAVIFRESPFPASDELRTVLVTGAAGRIGSCFAELSHDRYKLRLMVRGDEAEIDAIRPFGDVVECDLADQQGLKDACAGIDTVIHLAADHRVHARWEEQHRWNLQPICRRQGAGLQAGGLCVFCERDEFRSTWHPNPPG